MADPAADPIRTEAFRLHAELCKVLTDAKRLLVLDALRSGERSVGELAAIVGCTLPNVSQHLGVLRHAGLVLARRTGTTVHYRLVEPRITAACDLVHSIVLDRVEHVPFVDPRDPAAHGAGSPSPLPAVR